MYVGAVWVYNYDCSQSLKVINPWCICSVVQFPQINLTMRSRVLNIERALPDREPVNLLPSTEHMQAIKMKMSSSTSDSNDLENKKITCPKRTNSTMKRGSKALYVPNGGVH